MTIFERPLVDDLVRLLADDLPPRIVAVTGPRQSGKTTIVRQALRRARATGLRGWHIGVDDPQAGARMRVAGSEATTVPVDPALRNTEWLIGIWEQARDRAWRHEPRIRPRPRRDSGRGGLVGCGQGACGIGIGETGCPLKVIILGSAPWALLTGRGESLAGRFIPLDVRHWSLQEMVIAFDFDLNEYLFFGGYPGAAPLIRDMRMWRGYVAYSIIAPVFGRDILALTRVDKPALMRQLVDLVPEYSGQIVRYTNLVGRLRDAGNATTVGHYLDLLSDAGIVARLPNYSGSAVRRTGSSPKLNVLNTGLMTALSGYSFDQALADRTFWGGVVESAVGAHLHNTLEPAMRLCYWRDDPDEVDFVLSRGPRVLGIEVKSGRWARALRGLRAFENRFPKARTTLVGGRGGIPLNEFLAEPASFWLEGDW